MKKTITLTNKECEVLDDMFMYMVDYMEDRCWSGADKRAFDRIYRKQENHDYNACNFFNYRYSDNIHSLLVQPSCVIVNQKTKIGQFQTL